MLYTTHNTKRIDVDGTSLQGHIDAGYGELVDLFGKPTDGDGYKVDAEWNIEFVGLDRKTTVATIYNYKDGVNYCGAEGKPTEQIRDWHVGGMSKQAAELVSAQLAMYRASPKDTPKRRVADHLDFKVMGVNADGSPLKEIETAEVKKALLDGREKVEEMMDSIRAKDGDDYLKLVKAAMQVRKIIEMMHGMTQVIADQQAGKPFPIPAAVFEDMVKDTVSSCGADLLTMMTEILKLEGRSVNDVMAWADRISAVEDALVKDVRNAIDKQRGI